MMRRSRPDWVDEVRRSVDYFPEYQRPESYPKLTAYMFVEDLRLGIIPLGSSAREKFTVAIQGSSGCEEVIFRALGYFGENWRKELSEIFAKFVEDAVGYLAYFGEIWYELVRNPEEKSAEKRAQMTLVPLPPGRVTQFGPVVVQNIPKVSRRELGKTIVILPARHMWHLTFPKELGTARQHGRLLRLLEIAGTPVPHFALEDMRLGRTTRGYDVQLFAKELHAMVAWATRNWGWPGRGSWQEHTTEFYQIFRYARFAIAKAKLRDHIISKLNDLLEREQLSCRIQIGGVLAPEALERLLSDLLAGRTSLKTAVSTIFAD